jgi:hypothetical protein
MSLPDASTPPAPPGSHREGHRSELRARRRRRAMLRLDVVLAALVALVGILASPGIAMAGIVAALVMIVAGVWILVERRPRRRRRRGRPAR